MTDKPNLSRNDHEYHVGNIVVLDETDQPALIDHVGWDEHFQTHVYDITTVERVFVVIPEARLRPMTWGEYCYFRHPKKKRMRVGKTPFPVALYIHLFALLIVVTCIISMFTIGPSMLIPLVIPVGMIAGFWIYTHRNFTGKTV